MALTPPQRARIAYHLGFPGISQATAIALGFPAASHTRFILESALERLLPDYEPMVLRALTECECIDGQLADARKNRIQVSSVDTINLRGPGELEDLEDQYSLWTDKLADLLGVVKNPFSLTHARGQVMAVQMD
jgi:hypothetical protein